MDTFLQLACVCGAIWFGFCAGLTEFKNINAFAIPFVLLPFPLASVGLMVLAWLIGHPGAL